MAGMGSKRGQRGRGKEREEKQGTYFPVYPNLRKAQRSRAGRGGCCRKSEKERKRGEQGRKQELVTVIKEQEKWVMKW